MSSQRPPITAVPLTRPRYSRGRALGAPRLLVIHATAGRYPGDYGWLRAGGGDAPHQAISCHYYIRKTGAITQFVADDDTAWHTGAAAWDVDGSRVSGSHQGVARLNWLGIGIELENLNNGRDPYPTEQIAAAVALARWLVDRHQIPREHLVRHLDIAPGRKTDPAGLDWPAFVEAVYKAPDDLSIHQPIMGGVFVPAALLDRALQSASYINPGDREQIVSAYTAFGAYTTIGNFLPFVQGWHETGRFADWKFADLRNPAGLGSTERSVRGHSFPTIAAGIAAQFAHLLCYAADPVMLEQARPDLYQFSRTSPRRDDLAQAYGLGCAPTWAGLGARWAVSPTYPDRIMERARRVLRDYA